MPRLSGLEALRRLKAAFPELAVLVLTMHASEPYLFQVIQAGGAGYVLKQTADEHLLGAIRDAARGSPSSTPHGGPPADRLRPPRPPGRAARRRRPTWP